MLNCKINKGIVGSCSTSIGGIQELVLANWSGSHKYTSSNSGCSIDSIDLGTEKAYKFDFADGTGSYNVQGQVGSSRDQKYLLNTETVALPHIDCENLANLTNLFLAKVVAFVKDKNGRAFILGAQNGLSSSAFDLASGAAEGDASGLTITLDGSQSDVLMEIADWSIVEQLLG